MGMHIEDGNSRLQGLVDGAPLPSVCDSGNKTDIFKDVAPANSLSEKHAETTIPHGLAQDLEALPSMESDIRGVLQDLHTGCQVVAAAGQTAGLGGSLMSLGSFQLGLLRPGDELDLLYVATSDIPLSKLCDKLAAHFETQASVCTVMAEGDLAAPGLTFNVRGVDVRLFLAQRVPGLPPPAPKAVAKNMAALYARDASETLLKNVPNAKVFRALSKFVRHWARQRGIYGTYLGFFGGPAWTVCCARVCQMHPQAELAQLVLLFFRTLRNWDWSQPFCILPDVNGRAELANLNNQQATVMDAVLPLGRDISVAPHVSDTTSKIMLQELLRAYRVANQLDLARAHGPIAPDREQQPADLDLSNEGWANLVPEPQFFKCFQHYLQLEFMASNEEVMHKWFQWAKKCMSELVPLFEAVGTTSVVLRPWPEFFLCGDADWPHGRAIFIGLQLERKEQPDGMRCRFDLREPTVRLLESITAWPHADRYKGKFEFCIKHVRQNDVERWLANRPRGDIASDDASNVAA